MPRAGPIARVANKVSDSGEDKRLYYGVSRMQGWRYYMEDADSAVLDIAPESNKRVAWFAVYDGHGGLTSQFEI
jgi:protein phosphatase 2C family protein 2/3